MVAETALRVPVENSGEGGRYTLQFEDLRRPPGLAYSNVRTPVAKSKSISNDDAIAKLVNAGSAGVLIAVPCSRLSRRDVVRCSAARRQHLAGGQVFDFQEWNAVNK